MTDTVVSYELFKIAPRWLLLRVETERGVIGWGEPNLEGFSDTVKACVDELMKSVVGEDAARIQYILQKLQRQKFYSGGPVLMSAIAGIDQALWDIKGKTLSVPVYSLLGGHVRTRMLMYRWCGGDDNTPEEAAAEAADVLKTTNFKQLKMNATPRMSYIDSHAAVQAAVRRMKAVREAVGPDIGIGLDFHGRVKLPMAKTLMKALEPYHPLFYEEPVVKGQNKSLKDLAHATHIPLATGERMHTVEEFRDLLEDRSVNILQPDVSHVGGISNLLTISRMAEAYEVSLAPHCPLGPIALASCLAVDAVSLNFAFQESSIGIHYNKEGGQDLLDYVKNKSDFDITDGYMNLLGKPGLGVEIDEERVREAAKKGHNWADREWTLPDGAPTTW
eukprot:TRINITY_DN4404_c0_g1_i1.p1 TRINITY_DN4404_c0_g1~~TRINITY_DN4404_c0_g1_i1.p1  ORF type:complete len:390 (+),score=105.28 TRINITY_DN4404_c0_g1_i1:512-1681(+)